MSISGSLVGYENNNVIGSSSTSCGSNKKRNSISARSLLHNNSSSSNSNSNKASSMGKLCPSSLNSSISNSVITNASSNISHHHQHHQHQQHQQQQHHQQHQQPHHPPHQQQQQHLMNAKRKHAKYSHMHSDMDQTNNLHLNSLWSIWYGVMMTLFQGYLAVHGAYRFLGCSLIQWKIEPVAELNLQIVLSGVVFILLPLFFTSAVFKVGNLANDGIKLAAGGSKQPQRCSMAPHDGLEEEAGGGTLRALWTHGGPTAAFVHIVIAMCLLLPRLLLEARIIENGLLPRDNIWRTELDFISVSRRNLVVMSVINAPYQNTSNTDEEDDYFNDTMFTAVGSNNNLLDAGAGKRSKPGTKSFFEVPDLMSGESFENDAARDIGGNANRTGERIIVGEMDRDEFLATSPWFEAIAATTTTNMLMTPTIKATTAKTTTLMPTLTTPLIQKSFDKSNAQKLNTAAKGNSLESSSTSTSTAKIPKPTTTTTTATSSSTATSTSKEIPTTSTGMSQSKTTTITDAITITIPSITTSTATSSSSTTTSSTKSTTSEAATTGSSNVATPETPTETISGTSSTATNSSSSTTTKTHHHQTHHHNQHQHHHQHHQQHHLGKATKKHSNRQHRQRIHNHRRHHSETRLTHSEEYERGLEERPTKPIDFNSLDDITMTTGALGKSSQRLSIEVSSSYEEDSDYAARRPPHQKSSSTTSTTTRDSNIHIVKPEMLPEIVPSTPIATNSKIIEIKTNDRSRKVKRMADEEMQVEIEPEYLFGDVSNNDSYGDLSSASTSRWTAATPPAEAANGDSGAVVRLDGFAGMLQIFFGIEKPIDVAVFGQPPSAEFVNLLFALLVWSVRYPAVFWTTTKPFATLFSIQMIASALDIIFSYVGVSNLYKLQVYSEAMPVQNSGLILNGVVTLSLFLLSTSLLIASSMIMYLYGHGRLAAKMRDRSLITLKSSETWIYFAHCASLCYVLALAVVKAPLLNDLSATYRSNLHCTTFFSALISVVHILLWIVIWLGLTAKRRWNFKLPPVDTFGLTKASTQPLLMSNRGSVLEQKSMMSTASSTDGGVDDIYWPKLTPSSPKLKVTFNEVTSTSDDVLLIGDHEQTDGKRNSSRGTTVCFTSAAGEVDDGDYATLRSATATTVVGIGIGVGGTEAAVVGYGGGVAGDVGGGAGGGGATAKLLHLTEYDELPPPPPPLTTSCSALRVAGTGVGGGSGYKSNDYSNSLADDNTSEEGKLLACVRDDSVTYASTRDLEPTPPLPLPPPLSPHNSQSAPNSQRPVGVAPQAIPEIMQLSSSPEHLVSPLAPVTVTVHTNEAHISSSSTTRCLRRADSGVPHEALSPRSDTESTTSPPERAPSESSSGVHSGEERDVEVVIRPRATCKPPAKPPQPAIQEEPYGRSTNMKMSSFITDVSGYNRASNSSTLPLTRTVPDQKFDYSHCSTMPLPAGGHSYQQHAAGGGGGYSTSSSACVQQQQQHSSYSSHYKPQQVGNYANSAVAMAAANAARQQQQQYLQQQPQQQPLAMHTTLPNGVRYSNPHFLRRLPHVTMSAAESPYGHLGLGAGHHTFSKIIHDPLQNSLANTTIPEDRDSANYSMTSDHECNLYATAAQLN